MELSLYIKDKLVSGKRVAIPIMTHPGIELLGKRVLDAVTNGEIHYHAIRVLNECFPQSAACTTIMDLTVEAEAFGARLSMSPNEVPSVCGRLLTGYADVEALQIPSVESGRMPQYLLADRLAGTVAHVNLIPLNFVEESSLRPSPHVAAFQRQLEQRGITATVRRRLGSDIDASCGQLRRKAMQAQAR